MGKWEHSEQVTGKMCLFINAGEKKCAATSKTRLIRGWRAA